MHWMINIPDLFGCAIESFNCGFLITEYQSHVKYLSYILFF